MRVQNCKRIETAQTRHIYMHKQTATFWYKGVGTSSAPSPPTIAELFNP